MYKRYDRRQFMNQVGAGTTVLASGLILPRPAHAAGVAFPWASNSLAGDAWQASGIDPAIDELNNQRSLVSLANDATLEAECKMVADAAEKGINDVSELRKKYSGKLSNAQKSAAIAAISAIVGGIGLAFAAFASAPVWIGLAVGVGTASAAWSLVQFQNTSGTDKAIVGVSHFSGRFSLIGAYNGVSAAAKAVGKAFSVLAIAADLYSLVKASIAISNASDKLDEVAVALTDFRNQYRNFSGNLNACRTARLAEIDSSVEALKFVRDLGVISTGPGPIILD